MKGPAAWLTAPFGIAGAIRKHVLWPEHPRRMNLILSGGTIVRRRSREPAMPIQRKVFRIEEHARRRAGESVAADGVDGALKHREFMTELQALRELIGPRAGVDRDALLRARAQIAEAQAFHRELGLIYAAVERTRDEMSVLSDDMPTGEQTARARRELHAIVGGTEQATQSILQP